MEIILNMKLKDTYHLVEWGSITKVEKYLDEYDREKEELFNQKYTMFSNGSNLVLICKLRYEDEEEESLDIVLGSLLKAPYNSLCKALDSKKGIAAYIYQVYGTTSDVFLFDRSDGVGGTCDSASDIMKVVYSHDLGYKYIDLTK